MLQIPPIPSWDAMHPLIIHFPIALLLLSPLFILISAILTPSKSRPYFAAGLMVLLLGTAGLYLAASTGEAAAELAEQGNIAKSVLSTHEHLASETKVIFSVLSIVLLGMFFVPRILHRQETRVTSTYLPAAFLVLYAVGVLPLVNTAHAGGRLVHEFGVHAQVAPAAGEQALPPTAASKEEKADED